MGKVGRAFLETDSERVLKLVALRYEDDMVRTTRGWRIASRTLVNVVGDLYIKAMPGTLTMHRAVPETRL